MGKFIYFLFISAAIMTPGNAADFWQPPDGPRGGHVTSILRTNDGMIYLGTFTTGVFRSSDNGQSWQSINNGLNGYEINNLATDQNENLYAAVGSSGIFVSTDKGESWSVFSSVIRDESIQAMFVESDGTMLIAARGQGIYKSSDAGTSWQYSGLKAKIILTIVKSPNGDLFAAGNDGVYRFNAATQTWDRKSEGIPNVTAKTLAFSENGDAIYCGTYSAGVLRSDDNGETWTPKLHGFKNYIYGWIEQLMFDAQGRLWAAVSHNDFGGVYYSDDKGENWIEIETGISHKKFQSILVHKDDIFLGVFNYGLYHSVRPFDKWEPRNNGFWFFTTNCLTSDRLGNVYAGTPGAGVFLRQNGGQSWVERNDGVQMQTVQTIDCTRDGRLFLGIARDGVYISDSTGESWTLHRNGLHNLNFNALAHNDDSIFLGTNLGLYMLKVDGDTWERATSLAQNAMITALHVQNNIVYAGTNTGKIIMSNDNGKSWTDRSAGMATQYISSISMNDEIDLFVAARTAGIFGSTDNGETWVDYTLDLPTRVINVLRSFHNHLYAGTEQGVFRLEGKRWISVNEGLWDINIHDIHIDHAGYLWAATDLGAARSASKTTQVEDKQKTKIPASLKLYAPSPNPFNALTRIQYFLNEPAIVKLKIYNISGRLLETLVQARESAGYHTCSWDAGAYASGIYFVRLRVGGEIRVAGAALQK